MNNKLVIKDELTEFLLYTAPNGEVKIEIFFHNENVWLSQKRMAELFGVDITTINEHLKNIYTINELSEISTIGKFPIVQFEGKREVKRFINFYNLDAIISVGYRVNSSKATQFRIWATERLREFILKGFVIDDERMKNGQYFGKDYFRELLERIRSIRSSERRMYQQITDIFAECSIDYDKNAQTTRDFYATVQNKFHFAISGQTAAEIIYNNANAKKDFMGLQTWKSAPDGRIIKSDVKIAKNYLKEDEIKHLERSISGFFDYIERIIENRISFTMQEFAKSVNKFLDFNEYKILAGKGAISARKAEQKAFNEYNKFNKTQKIVSDFDKIINEFKNTTFNLKE